METKQGKEEHRQRKKEEKKVEQAWCSNRNRRSERPASANAPTYHLVWNHRYRGDVVLEGLGDLGQGGLALRVRGQQRVRLRHVGVEVKNDGRVLLAGRGGGAVQLVLAQYNLALAQYTLIISMRRSAPPRSQPHLRASVEHRRGVVSA